MLAFGDQVTFASPDSGLLEAEGLLDARLWVRTGGEPGDGQSCLFEVVPLRPGEGEVAGQPVLYGYLIQLRHVRSGLFVALRERVLAHPRSYYARLFRTATDPDQLGEPNELAIDDDDHGGAALLPGQEKSNALENP